MKVLNALLFRQTYNLHNFYLQFAWLLFTKYIELLCQSENITFRPKTFSDYDSLFTPGSNWKETTMKPLTCPMASAKSPGNLFGVMPVMYIPFRLLC